MTHDRACAARLPHPLHLLAACMAASLSTAAQTAEPTAVLSPVQVVGSGGTGSGVKPSADTAGTVYETSAEDLSIFGAPGGTQPYAMASGTPGVKSSSLDAYAMTSRIGGNKGMRVRGIAAWHGANGTVDGLTLSNINPGPGYLQMFDAENLSGVSMAQGPVAPDRPGLFNTAGALDSHLLWPVARRGGTISVAAGDDDFARYALRADTGSLGPNDTRLAFSATNTHANLWRGPGESNRENYLLAASTQLGPVALRLLGLNSQIEQNNYRPLTAAQAKDLGTYRDLGYDATPTAGSYQNYYGYNRQAFNNQAFIAEADAQLTPETHADLKLFSFSETGSSFDGTATNRVREWLIDHDSHGLSTDVETKFGSTALKAGYAYTSLKPPGPPTAQRFYTATATGLTWTPATANSSNQGWTTLSAVTHRHNLQTLYALAERGWGDLKGSAGLRYFQERLPSLAEYNKTGVAALPVDDAIDASSGTTISVEGRTVRKWLPWAELRYALARDVEGRLAVGRNIGPPSFDIWNSNLKNLPSSQQTRAQALWSALKPETNDAVDLGLQIDFANGYVAPTLYYARIRNKSVNVYDSAVGFAYGQNVGNGHLAGAQVAWGVTPIRTVEVFGSASYSRAVFDENLQTAANTVLAVQGLQFPDTPKVMATLGAQWKSGIFSAGPLLRYQGSRYDDSVHTNRVDGYFTVDLHLGAQWPVGPTEVAVELTVLNALDKRYIAVIDAGDLQTGTTSFYPGAPRTAVARLTLKY